MATSTGLILNTPRWSFPNSPQQTGRWARSGATALGEANRWIVPESAATKDAPASKGDGVFLTPDMFVQHNDPYFKTNGFFERSIGKRVEEFGNLVEVWSTKESRDAKNDAQPSSRGIDSFQIVHAHGRFWIASLLLDDERPGVTLPAKYLKRPGYEESVYESPALLRLDASTARGSAKKLTALFLHWIPNSE